MRAALLLVAALLVQTTLDARNEIVDFVALAQVKMPRDPAATRAADLVELVKLDPSIKLDIRYAGTNNFLGKPVYKESRAFLQRPAAIALLQAHRELAAHGSAFSSTMAIGPGASPSCSGT